MSRNNFLFLTFAILLLTNISTLAQNVPTKSGNGNKVNIRQVQNVLYEQMIDFGPNYWVSQNFDYANNSYDSQGADDFIIPSGNVWEIESIDVLGAYYNGPGPANSFNIWFYTDDGGLPGTAVASVLNSAYIDSSGTGSVSVEFSPPIVLQSGTYWFSIQCNMDFGTGGEWGWYEQTQNGSESMWRNPLNGFGTPCTSWGARVTDCGLGFSPYYDFSFRINGNLITPVELTSFRAFANNGIVLLNWTTATETNNKCFVLERKLEKGQYQDIATVAGYGTTSQSHQYSYLDGNLTKGNYTYRLKQIDFDGTFKYSKEVNVSIDVPNVYLLQQNYPNPFNPSTKIDFTLESDSKVTLNVYNMLGQLVKVLVNSNLSAGSHTINFNASNLNSGVYFYKMKAQGFDGKSFVSIKKMILTK